VFCRLPNAAELPQSILRQEFIAIESRVVAGTGHPRLKKGEGRRERAGPRANPCDPVIAQAHATPTAPRARRIHRGARAHRPLK
jgi:hypothetical protein